MCEGFQESTESKYIKFVSLKHLLVLSLRMFSPLCPSHHTSIVSSLLFDFSFFSFLHFEFFVTELAAVILWSVWVWSPPARCLHGSSIFHCFRQRARLCCVVIKGSHILLTWNPGEWITRSFFSHESRTVANRTVSASTCQLNKVTWAGWNAKNGHQWL